MKLSSLFWYSLEAIKNVYSELLSIWGDSPTEMAPKTSLINISSTPIKSHFTCLHVEALNEHLMESSNETIATAEP